MKLETKQDFRNLMYEFLEPLKSKFSEGNAKILINGAGATYNEDIIGFESFSRPLWAIVPFLYGGGEDKFFEKKYLKGVIEGTNPNSKEYWGNIRGTDQRFVEMAALATSLIFCGDKFFTLLSDIEKENLTSWLLQINDNTLPENNWLFFRVLVNIGLKKNGMNYSAERIKTDLETIESYYLENGWYKDGISEHRDYYIPFAMHYYGLLYAKVMEHEDVERSKLFKERAKVFAEDFVYFFANSGEAIPYGRSLTYRFAQCSFFSAILFAEVDVFDVGVIKGIITRHFDYWLSQEIFRGDGILNIGYNYENLIMSERYNAPGSPYWSMKAFLLLALKDDHPFWQCESKPLPTLNKVRKLAPANMLIQRQDNGDNVNAYLPAELELYGHGHIIEKYSKFVYSTAFGFSVMRSAFCLEEASPDSMLAFVIDDTVFVRKISREYQVLDNKIISVWSPFVGIVVTTTICLTEDGHTRTHNIESDYDCFAYECGFSLPKFSQDYKQQLKDNSISVESDKKTCEVIDLEKVGMPYVIDCFPNTNVLFKNTVLPCIKYKIKIGKTDIKSEIKTFVR